MLTLATKIQMQGVDVILIFFGGKNGVFLKKHCYNHIFANTAVG
jgi:hypothetical protein